MTTSPHSSSSYRLRQRTAAVAGMLALAMLCAACGGSAIAPEDAQAANAAVLGQAGADPGSSGPGGSDGGVPATDPGSDAPTEPGQNPSGPASDPTSGPGTTTNPGVGGGGSVPAGGGVRAASCAGFRNGTGITDETITIGNSSDVSGPVPGLFQGAQLATKAYVAYFNATNPNGICGRKLALITDDSRTDNGADQAAYVKMCDKVFATVGSMSAFDSGGAETAQACGLPDIRSAAVTFDRNKCSTCFGVQATGDGEFTNPVYDFWIRRDRAATQKAAMLYLSAGAAAENGKTQMAVGAKRGMKWIYSSAIDVASFNYGPYVQAMKSKGVEFVQFLGAYQQSVRLAQAMRDGGFKPKVLMYDPSVYDQGFLKSGGNAVEGAYMFITFQPLDSNQPEVRLYRQWLDQVSPGAQPTFFGLFSWSATKLFVEEALRLGGKLNRPGLVAKLRAIEGWTGGGAHVPMSVGSKRPPVCAKYMTVKGNRFVPFGSTDFLCTGRTKA